MEWVSLEIRGIHMSCGIHMDAWRMCHMETMIVLGQKEQ